MRYLPKESKSHATKNLARTIQAFTGIPRGCSEAIADAIVRNRDVGRLAIQKNWPITDGLIEGPLGNIGYQEYCEKK